MDVEQRRVEHGHGVLAQALGMHEVGRVGDALARHAMQRHQVQLAVREGRALGLARGAGGVAQRGDGVLVQIGPLKCGWLFCDQLFVLDQVGDLAVRQAGLVRHVDKGLDRVLDAVVDVFQQRQHHVVD
ncbi:hypothetical protein D3C85_1356770 [compost metagenome]